MKMTQKTRHLFGSFVTTAYNDVFMVQNINMCSAYFVISCTVQKTEFTGLIKTCRKKITSFVFFYLSTHIQNDIADRDISSMQIDCS